MFDFSLQKKKKTLSIDPRIDNIDQGFPNYILAKYSYQTHEHNIN